MTDAWAGMAQGTHRIAHGVQTIEEINQIEALGDVGGRLRDFETDTLNEAGCLGGPA